MKRYDCPFTLVVLSAAMLWGCGGNNTGAGNTNDAGGADGGQVVDSAVDGGSLVDSAVDGGSLVDSAVDGGSVVDSAVDAGECTGPQQCDDSLACTIDTCVDGACHHSTDDTVCDNGAFCDGAETCAPSDPSADTNGCIAGTAPNCDDNVGCTDDSCDESADTCVNVPNDAHCPDDGVFCNGAEYCDAVSDCSAVLPTCDDNVACTDDYCDQQADACAASRNDHNCSNGLFCDGAEVCEPSDFSADSEGCIAGTPPNCDDGFDCTDDSCNEATDTCDHAPDDSKCDNHLFCDGTETCVPGVGCQAGQAVDCKDNVACTIDSCNESTDSCDNIPNDAACDDGLWCNGAETCDGATCIAGTPPLNCDDSIACTDDACSEATQTCTFTANHANCNSGEFCIPPSGGCTPATDCSSDPNICDDGDDCNGVETCNGTYCVAGTPVDCDDHVGCTIDTCDPDGGTCSNVPNDAACDDGLACTGVETCDTDHGCQAGTPVDCDDHVSCTIDACVEPAGTCAAPLPQDGLCDDGVFCNGAETCDLTAGCQAGTTPTCDDGVACTNDSCDPVKDQCTYERDNSNCPCGQSCDPVQGCGNWCEVRKCEGKFTFDCGDCQDNDMDCNVDDEDSMCLGPCDNNEAGYSMELPGGSSAPCLQDCYFDSDTTFGNDGCYWSHECDPLEVASNFDPEGTKCAYDPSVTIPGFTGTCADAMATQSQACLDFCLPRTPNGCDCFGCCQVPGTSDYVWLGSMAPGTSDPSCTVDSLDDPTQCRPCTPVTSCFNDCETCEICIGKPEVPSGCTCQDQCPANVDACGPGCAPCPSGYYCLTGCCVQGS